uniref:Bifunctional inhibitor/plant lipid transfer protein/seed storage helical domain-containing protein n=1 Tax=Oryza punctata TaxID=4537 RepID=A0A0E0M674_ORYPU
MARIVLVIALAAVVVVVQAAMAQMPGMPPAVVPPSLPTTPPAPAVVSPPLPTTPPSAVVAPAPPLPPMTPPPAIVPPALPPPPPLPAIVVPPALPPTPAIVFPPALPPIPVIVPPSLPPTPPPSSETNLPCVAELTPCSEFYQNATAKPTDACCTPLKKAYESELGCLCSVLTNPAMAAAVGVDMKKGLDLFGRCGVKVPADVCSSHAPAPAPNSDSSTAPHGAQWMAYSSFFSILLVAISTLVWFLPVCPSRISGSSPVAAALYQCTIATYPLSLSLRSLRLSCVKRQERYGRAFILMPKNMIWNSSINSDPY